MQGKRGPKPLPLSVLRARGVQPQGERLDAIEPDIQIPDAPEGLSEAGRREWDRITPQLLQLGLISRMDLAALHAYCESYASWADACAKVRRMGAVLKVKNVPVQNPYLAVADKSLAFMHRFLTEFGLTPASRTRIGAPSKRVGPGSGDGLEERLFGGN